jgi:hypothetical protein
MNKEDLDDIKYVHKNLMEGLRVPLTKMSKEEFYKLSREWLDSGDWKITSLSLDLKTWLEMQGHKLSQEEFDRLNK